MKAKFKTFRISPAQVPVHPKTTTLKQKDDKDLAAESDDAMLILEDGSVVIIEGKAKADDVLKTMLDKSF
ncbi:hypothetical protein NL676_009220 [Syzygium grande]|nr:hypothetical protein NL676_009220 [Syzygium grande]